MPRVPTYQDNVPTVVESGRPFGDTAQNVAPSFDYEHVMQRALQPINHAVDTVVKLEAHYRDTAIKANADEQLDAFNREVQDTLYAPEGYFNQKGKNAVDNWDASQQKLDEIYNKHLGALDDEATRQAFKSSALPQVRTIRQNSITYRNRQNDVWRVDASKAHAASLTNQFAYEGFGPGSENTMASLMNEVEYQGRMAGQSDEWIAQQKEAHKSLAYASAYERLMTENPEAAMRHFQQFGNKEMTPGVAQKVLSSLFSVNRKEIATVVNGMGGTTALSLTSGAVSRERGGTSNGTIDDLNAQSSKFSNVQKAQQGLGAPPKVDAKVLNTSGYKGCNPLNIRATGDKWQGIVGQTDGGYLIFGSPVDGIRAASKVLMTYSRKYGIDTPSGIVSRFAPATENPTNQYIQNVCKELGVKPDDRLDMNSPEVMRGLLKAMMKQEIGGVAYSDETIDLGIQRAMRRDNSEETVTAQQLETQEAPKIARITPQDLVLNPDVKTGYDLFDNLPRAYKFMVLQDVKVQKSQSNASLKNDLALQVKNGLSQALNTGDVSAMPTEDAFITVYGQLAGTEQFRQAQRQATLNANIYAMPGMSNEQLMQMSRQLTPDKGDPQYAARMEQKELWDKAVQQTVKQRAADPIQYAITAYPELQFQPIDDWTNSTAVLNQFQKRIDNYQQVSDRFGTQPAILTKSEVAGFLSYLQTMDTEHQADFVQKLSDTLFVPNTQNSEPLAILATQFGDKNKLLSIALGVASTEKGRETNGAARQIKGNFVYSQKIGEAWKDEKKVRETLADILPVANGSDTFEAMVSAVMNEHCFGNQAITQAVEQSISNVFGRVHEYNGGKIFLPTQLDKAKKDLFTFRQIGSFEDLLSDAGKDFAKSNRKFTYAGQQINGQQLANLLSSGKLKSVSDGVYFIQDGLRYVTDGKGVPVRLDLNVYIDRRRK